MNDSIRHRLEKALAITLPSWFVHSWAAVSDEDFPYLVTDPEELIRMNEHFVMDPNDLSSMRGTGILAAIRFWLFYKRPSTLVADRQRYKKAWAAGHRFVIGSDLGEESYFVVLDETSSKVYRFDLETKRVSAIADSLEDWVVEARRREASVSEDDKRFGRDHET